MTPSKFVSRMHLLVKRQCFAQFGRKGSAACRVMFPQPSLETKRCKNIRERDSANWGSLFSHSLIFNLFQTAKIIAFSQVNAACVPRPFCSYSLILNFIPNCQNHRIFTGKRCMCPSSLLFLCPNSQLIPNCQNHCVFTGKRCMCLSCIFFLSPFSRLIRLTWPCQWTLQLEQHETAPKLLCFE